ncbi:MAG: ACR3 family arsenite efflux transporter [Chloroflexi bacterium]|nr:ACR3 family arsenite efflux transporter [Chloroflexota bacterium]
MLTGSNHGCRRADPRNAINDEKSIKKQGDKTMNKFEKYLALWVALCMLAGVGLSQTVPGIGKAIDSWQIRGISIPIGICLFLMMYPALLNLQVSELKKLRDNPKPVMLSLFSNWVVAPLVAAGLAYLFLRGHDELTVAVILLGSSPCTAMVLVWGKLSEGNQEQNVVNTSLNTITIMALYVPLVSLLTGIQDIPVDRGLLAVSAFVFIGIPLILGIISKRILIRARGETWFENTYRPIVGKIAIGALLMTLVVLFSLNGQVLIDHFDQLLLVSVPLLLGFVIVLGFNLFITRAFGLSYREAIITVIIGSSSHFEIAIATAVAMYGVGSYAALGTTMGLFWEVPIMLGLVFVGKVLQKRGFWKESV